MLQKVVVIVITLFVLNALGQKVEVILSVDPLSVEIGELFTLSVKSSVQGEVEIDNLPRSFVYGYDVMNGMEQEMDYNTGNVITYYFLSQTGAISKTGKFTLGPAYIKKGSKTYKSNMVTISVGNKTQMSSGDVTEQQLNDPAFGIIQTKKSTIYEGEPVLVTAKVYSKFEPTYLDGYLQYELKGSIDKHTIVNSNRIIVEMEQFRGKEYYTFKYDKNLIFPTGTGKFKIQPFSMNLHYGHNSFPIKSSHAIINVKPLPPNPPSDFIGAVGNFDVHRSIEGENLKQGDVLKMKVVISGVGNLQNSLEPKHNLPKGFIIYGDATVAETISYGSRGAEGKIEYEYNIQVSKPGDVLLPPTSISYFDLSLEKYVSVTTAVDTIHVDPNKNFVVSDESNSNDNELLELTETPKLRSSIVKSMSYSIYGTSLFWIGVSSPILTALIFLLFIKRRKRSIQETFAKNEMKRKEKELSSGLFQLKSLVHQTNENEFYAGIETALKRAFEVFLKIGEDRIIDKQKIYAYLNDNGQKELSDRVKTLFSKCDQYRFGLAATNESKTKLLDELNSIINEIKK
jgi:hypothetical protein